MTETRLPDDTTVYVCAACLRASCWYGDRVCNDYRFADVVVRTVGELRAANTGEGEAPWSDAEFKLAHMHLTRPPRDGPPIWVGDKRPDESES